MNHKESFTLVEVILYVAIFSIFIGGLILFLWESVFAQVKSNSQQEVADNLRIVSERITYEIRNAASIDSLSSSSISITTADASRNPTVFDLSDQKIRIGYGSSGACPASNPCDLTSNLVVVDSLNFEDYSELDDRSIIRYTINMSFNNPGEQNQYDYSSSVSSTVHVRTPPAE